MAVLHVKSPNGTAYQIEIIQSDSNVDDIPHQSDWHLRWILLHQGIVLLLDTSRAITTSFTNVYLPFSMYIQSIVGSFGKEVNGYITVQTVSDPNIENAHNAYKVKGSAAGWGFILGIATIK